MSLPLSRLRSLLLDLLSPARHVTQQLIDGLDDGDWRAIAIMARQHRLEPLLSWRLDQMTPALSIAEPLRTAWSGAHHQSTLRALAVARELVLIHRILDRARIPHLALKGADLAFHIYPQPGLRPMRDIDVLVPRDRMAEAFEALLANGLQRCAPYQGTVDAALATSHQLPPLRSPSGTLGVELHHRLFHIDKHGRRVGDLCDDPGFWQRAVSKKIAGESVRFAGPTELLLHLTEHAVYGHRFNNGPLTFCDIGYLLLRESIDWPLFWLLAERHGCARGAALVLRVVESQWGVTLTEDGGRPPSTLHVPDEIVERALQLSLCDLDVSVATGVLHEANESQGLGAKLGYFWRRLFPSRVALAALYPAEPNSWRIFIYYFAMWWRLSTKRLPELVRAARTEQLDVEMASLRRLDGWLGKAGARSAAG